MEFPDLGEHCSDTSCKRLDFLPMKCDACNGIFCRDHLFYDSHSCPSAYKKDVQVPVCPLCMQPIPVPRGQAPDILVGQHIDRDCKSDPAQKHRKKVYSNRCSMSGCKVKEMVPVTCASCRKNFCLKHRHETDHSCGGLANSANQSHNPAQSLAAKAAERRSQPRRTNVTEVQGSMSEDEALARALQASMVNGQPDAPLSQEQQDFLLAQALSASEQPGPTPRRSRTAERCSLS